MAERGYILTALEPLPRGDWVELSGTAMKSLGWNVLGQRSRVIAWGESHRYRSVNYADGWSLKRLWLGPSRWALSLAPQRLYFQPSGEPDFRPEREIVGMHRPEADLHEQVTQGYELCQQLSSSGTLGSCEPVPAEPLDCDLAVSRVIYIGDQEFQWASGTLNSNYRQHGFESVPENLTISVCPTDGVSSGCAERVAGMWSNAISARGMTARIRISSVDEVRARLDEMKSNAQSPSPGHCVLFLLNSRNGAAQSEFIQLLDALDAAQVPYRRAFADDPFEYSIPDQLPSVVQACGGVAHRIEMDSIRTGLWSVGVDLSHRQHGSVLALTLVDSHGVLQGAWTVHQEKDETARSESLHQALDRCCERLDELAGAEGLLVLRDGRLFENEAVGLYEDILKRPVSLLEFRKRGNPLVLACGENASPATSPSGFRINGISTIFLATTAPRTSSDLPRYAKVTWKESWNHLRLCDEEIAMALTRLSSAPGLGMHTHHLPAPIYWADGIAGTSPDDLRFRGQKTEHINTLK